jgi:hypothetical protein
MIKYSSFVATAKRLRAALPTPPETAVENRYWFGLTLDGGALAIRFGDKPEDAANFIKENAWPKELREKLGRNKPLLVDALKELAGVRRGRPAKNAPKTPGAQEAVDRLYAALGMKVSAKARQSAAQRLRRK